jgi:hypothetical protein
MRLWSQGEAVDLTWCRPNQASNHVYGNEVILNDYYNS